MSVQCKICGERFKQITATHLRKAHGISIEEYKTKFPDAPLVSDEINKKRKETYIEKFGVENPFQQEEIKAKIKHTKQDNSKKLQKPKKSPKKKKSEEEGYIHPLKRKEIREKRDQKILEKFGGSSPFCSEDIQEKSKHTNLEKYGTKNPQQNKDIQNKYKQTNLERYGHENPFGNKDIQEKIKNTNLERYGFENPYQNNEIRNKAIKTNLEKYGNENIFNNQEIQDEAVKTRLENITKEYKKILRNTEYQLAEEYKGSKQPHTVIHKPCGNMFTYIPHYGISSNIPVCRACYPTSSSSGEREMFELVKNLCPDAVQNNTSVISPYELDIYLPSKNLAIEYCGLYWHSEKSRPDKNYHYNKWKMCKDTGIQLLTIWDIEWLNKREKVESRLSYILQKETPSIGARKCVIKEIDLSQAREFCDVHHINGYQNSKIRLGAFHGDILVAVMTFSKRKISGFRESEWEVIRFCSNQNIPGIASKIFKHFCKEYSPEKVISYSDNRWDTGKLYEKLGFGLKSISNPGYYYTKDYKSLEHRYNFQKRNLVKKGHDPNLTEFQIMESLGYDKVWDCGVCCWEWQNSTLKKL